MSRNIAHLMNRGMLGASNLRITFHNDNTQWEDKLERHLFSLGERTFAPDSK